MLNTYTWYLNDAVDGKVHLDYREKRGLGVGPDLNLHLGQWGEATFKYYYLHDQRPNTEHERHAVDRMASPRTVSAFTSATRRPRPPT